MKISKDRKIDINKIFSKTTSKIICIKLIVDNYEIDELDLAITKMNEAWNILLATNKSLFKKLFSGIINRIFIRYDTKTGTYIPYFVLICILKNKIAMQEYKLDILFYVSWLSTWARTLNCCKNVKVEWNYINKNIIKIVFDNFLKAPTYIAANQKSELIIKQSLKHNRSIRYIGLFNRPIELGVIER